MGLFDFFKRKKTVTEPIVSGKAGRKAPPHLRGWSGTSVYAGRVSGHELNPDLAHDRWPRTVREMRRTDDAIGASMEALISTLLSATWVCEAGEESSAFSRYLADNANCMFGFGGYPGRLMHSWEDSLAQGLLYYSDGVRYGEVKYQYNPSLKQIDIVDPWVDRDLTAHEQWIFDGPRWVGVEQSYPLGEAINSRQKPVIPAEDLVLLTRGVEGQNLSGTGALRPIYMAWKRKRDLIDMLMIATERWAIGTPNLIIDETGARDAGVPHAELALQVEQVRASVDLFLKGDSARIESTPFVRVDTYGGTLDPSALLSLIEQCNQSIMLGFLLQFLHLGTTNSGSRAVGEVHQETWRRSLIQILDRVASAYNGCHRPGGGVIGRWVELNWPGVDPRLYPRLKHSGLDINPLLDLLVRAPHLASGSEWLKPSLADRNAVRRAIHLDPELPPPEPELSDEAAGVSPGDDDGEPDLPQVRPGNYSASNRDVADLLGISTARVNSLVRRSVAIDLEVPAIGSGRDRRWDLSRVHGWYQQLTGGDS